MVLFVGDVASDTRDREAFQEMDYTHFFGPSTKGMAKRVERIDDPERLPEYVARAFATAMNGRPGPVVLVLPEDMLTQAVEHAQALPRVEPVQAWSDPGALRSLRDMLLSAQKPLVICGGGGWTVQAAQALQRFAENWQLPVANAFRFQDTFDNHHPLYAGDVGIGINPALAARVRDSDLILAIGPRLGEMTTGGYTLLKAPKTLQKLVHIHGSAEELNRVYQADLAILSTMNAAARSLEVLTAPTDLPWGLVIAESNPAYPSGLPAGETFHPAFLYESLWSLLGVFVLLAIDRKFKPRWGQLFGLYLAYYSFGRIFIESIRIDPAAIILGLRTNVWSAILGLVLGLVIVYLQRKRHPGLENSVYLPGKEPIAEAQPAATEDSDAVKSTSE